MQIWLGNCGLIDVLLNSSTQPVLKVNCQLATRFSVNIHKGSVQVNKRQDLQILFDKIVVGFGRLDRNKWLAISNGAGVSQWLLDRCMLITQLPVLTA